MIEIRKIHDENPRARYVDTAKIYKVSPPVIPRVVLRLGWRKVPEELT